MNVQFDHKLISSFYLWLENKLISDDIGAVVQNQSNEFQVINDTSIPSSHIAYQGRYKQLVAESQLNSGFFVNGNFITGDTDTSNVYVDYENGRLIFPAASGSSLTVTANSTYKEVNTYLPKVEEEHILLHGDFKTVGQDDPFSYTKTGMLDEPTYIIPACFINFVGGENEPFCFGGEEDSIRRLRVTVIANSNYIVDGILSALKDTNGETFRLIPVDEFPYGAFFSLKSFPYSYSSLSAAQPEVNANLARIMEVDSYRLRNDAIRRSRRDFSVGFVEFEISTLRFPRA